MSKILNTLKIFGVDLSRTLQSIAGIGKYLRDYKNYKSKAKTAENAFPIKKMIPLLTDHLEQSGVASGQYFHQDIYVARRIFQQNPNRHIDVASRVDSFVAHVSVFRSIEVVDIRELTTTAKNINFLQADLMSPGLEEKLGQSDSVSCLHAIEHFGLGRYGDPIDPDGHIKGLMNLGALVKENGILYVSIPIGPERVEFNGHRIFNVTTVPHILRESFKLEVFSYIDDAGEIFEDVPIEDALNQPNFGCNFGCGIYEFRRL